MEAYAQTVHLGMELRFRQEAFRLFPAKAAHWIIAHELAHVYQKTLGMIPGGENEDENEKHADNLVSDWGIERNCLSHIEGLMSNSGSLSEACRKAEKYRLCE